MKCKSDVVKGTKVGPAFFLLVILYCLKGADEAHLPPSGNLRDHHNILQHVCDGIAIMKQGFKLGEDELHRPPVVALGDLHI